MKTRTRYTIQKLLRNETECAVLLKSKDKQLTGLLEHINSYCVVVEVDDKYPLKIIPWSNIEGIIIRSTVEGEDDENDK